MITLNTILNILTVALHILEMTMEAQTPADRAAGVARVDKVFNLFADLIDRFKGNVAPANQTPTKP